MAQEFALNNATQFMGKIGILGMPNTNKKLFFSKDGVVSQNRFAADLDQLRGQLGAASTICNLQQDRYLFSLGIVAALLNGQETVLPPSLAPEAILTSMVDAAAPVIFSQNPDMSKFNTRLSFESNQNEGGKAYDLNATLANNPAKIRVFSSGSTKKPKCNIKTWQVLRAGAGVTDHILRHLDADPLTLGLLGTTPPGHMYGLEATIFSSLGFGYCTYRDTIFYPADLELAIEAAKKCGLSKLVLVTSPAHLRFLEPAILAAPEIICILSATAPFPRATAARLDKRDNLKVMEIYGSTETGSMALRQTAFEEAWTLSAGFDLQAVEHGHSASAPHLAAPVFLEDEIKLHPDGRFSLLGRTGDMVNVRGKKSRLSALNSILSESPDIADGLFLHVKGKNSDLLAVAAVARPGLDISEPKLRNQIQRHLLQYLDGAFVPKKIVILDQIPRSATGKTTQETHTELARLAGILG
jgi:acyl-coenzyme A synthetase/AMP-(fatty) acid ligase